MIIRLKNRLTQFRKEESGATNTLEFAFMVPLVFIAFAFGVELTTHSNRQFQLDRGVEVTTRIIRLNTSAQYTHEILKQAICDNTGGLDDCSENLRLELLPMDPRDYTGLDASPYCSDSAQPVDPESGVSLGQQHELMLIRACYRFVPFMGSLGLGKLLAGPDGYGKMVTMSAFVQEPR
ncbi:TadE/TadG family type IV pilus assembly protein [Sulfitobacter donghicola]|uniref:Pilus biosynthesis protein TadE n=1 Tax=Sulfitobacter donghicola DSW-25 = KCTC 12864 = JCM 14565 TaxID=1300350 RepID=A0A073IHL1_9RHOB|nr:hypothetical protein [Sulfitobacter donghicola]KEJ89274.1 pilus biosynthesis protein TadE [Sulfitobacter donghicola DSW-25 = KCTC 12864 = JCM 14565]KIN69071.1 TadE-like protein [Sulfitobacter donghicola DSW-25 = KCTC 12864 = JCM 14565]